MVQGCYGIFGNGRDERHYWNSECIFDIWAENTKFYVKVYRTIKILILDIVLLNSSLFLLL